MGWSAWWRRKPPLEEVKLTEWRKRCLALVSDESSGGDATALAAELDALRLPEEEIEMEREMLSGLEAFLALRDTIARGTLPTVETGHRVVGTDICHFSAPCSMPDEPSQPSGRLILSGSRAIFAGGARAVTVPWHAVARVLHEQRDVVLVRPDREAIYRFRCNVFADTLSAALLARTLTSRHRQSRGV